MARDICAALGGFSQTSRDVWESDCYVCTAARGHLLELCEPHEFKPEYKRWSFRLLPIIPERFRIKPKPDLIPLLERIRKLVDRPDITGIVNACDAAREGELIFREILAFCRTTKPVERVWLQSLTAESIRDGFSRLRPASQFEGLANAAACRAKADWLIGLNATRALTLRMRHGLARDDDAAREVYPAGRVQTPTLALIVRRWREIRDFKPLEFYRVEVTLKDHDGTPLKAHIYRPEFKKSDLQPELRDDRWFEQSEAQVIVDEMQNHFHSGGTAALQRKVSRRDQAPPALFHLTALQQTMAQRHGWTAKRTLDAAQRCYEEHKVLTYPRTDSPCLPSDLQDKVLETIQTLGGLDGFKEAAARISRDGLKYKAERFDDSKVSDHFAIIPTGKLKSGITHAANLKKDDDSLLFDVVARRFLAAFQGPARHIKIERKGQAGGHSIRVTLREILAEPGWLATYGKSQDPEAAKVAASGPETLSGSGAKLENGTTKPPPAIDEAALLRLMQFAGRQVEDPELAAALTAADGIGTPATRAEIIENLKQRRYVTQELHPTPKGEALIHCLEQLNARRLTSAELTAELELQLSKVQKGEALPEAFMTEIQGYTREIVAAIAQMP
ncbi:MAG: hypothetical protein RIQ81_2598 [Pseudomonadota bacterium]